MGSIFAEKALYGSDVVTTKPAKSGRALGSALRGMRTDSCDFTFGAVRSSAVQDRSRNKRPAQSSSAEVKTVIGFYGVYDMQAQWEHDRMTRPRDQITEKLLGAPPMTSRKLFFRGLAAQLRHGRQEQHPFPSDLRPGRRYRRSGDTIGEIPHGAKAGGLLRAHDR